MACGGGEMKLALLLFLCSCGSPPDLTVLEPGQYNVELIVRLGMIREQWTFGLENETYTLTAAERTTDLAGEIKDGRLSFSYCINVGCLMDCFDASLTPEGRSFKGHLLSYKRADTFIEGKCSAVLEMIDAQVTGTKN
jgi:hypothetical protein